MSRALLAALDAAADQPPRAPRQPLCWAGAHTDFGSAEPWVLQRLAEAGTPFDPAAADPDTHLATLAQALRALGLAGRWRNEPIRLPHPRLGFTQIERGCARVFGLPTLAVHLIARAPDGRWWLQQRAASKAEDPNLWDTLVGGMVSATEAPREALARETAEEAGLELAQLVDLQPGPRFWTRRPVPDGEGSGYLQERVLSAVATVPEHLQPDNRDGEVKGFALWSSAELREAVATGRLTLDAARLMLRAL